MLTFPSVFAPGGLLNAGPQTAAWLWVGWYVARPYALASSSAVLLALLYEVNRLYRRLIQSETPFRTLVEPAPIGTCIVDDRGAFEAVNQALADIYGYSVAEL